MERISSKKQRKREKSPVDDAMDEDVEEDEGEYEIEKVLGSSTEIFKVRTVCLSWSPRGGLNILTGRDCVPREVERI